MPEPIYTKATWMHEEDYYIAGELLAKKGDVLEIHGKHATDGEYAVRGTRSKSFFWAKPEHIKLEGEIDG